ncbi:MAG TPA: hypothetical protein PK995_05655 [Bacteroidia bacterium]|nr:hypothetical protein [Bacteroidia bacterium]
MNKVFSRYLLLLLAIYIAVIPLFLSIQRDLIRYENLYLKDDLSNKNIFSFEMKIDDYIKSKINDGKEIQIDNEMYDIVDYDKVGDKIVLKIFKDSEETELLKKFRKLLHILDKINLSVFFSLNFFNDNKESIFEKLNIVLKKIVFVNFCSVNLSDVFIDKSTPPPEFVF